MTMSGTCACGRILWYTSKDELLRTAKKHRKEDYNEIKKYLDKSMPEGLLICPECGKRYSKIEFSELKDCMGYGDDSSYTHDPQRAYQQAIANAYTERYKSESNGIGLCFGLILMLVGMLTYLCWTLLMTWI